MPIFSLTFRKYITSLEHIVSNPLEGTKRRGIPLYQQNESKEEIVVNVIETKI